MIDKPQHLMYGNSAQTGTDKPHIKDKPQHLMYGNPAFLPPKNSFRKINLNI